MRNQDRSGLIVIILSAALIFIFVGLLCYLEMGKIKASCGLLQEQHELMKNTYNSEILLLNTELLLFSGQVEENKKLRIRMSSEYAIMQDKHNSAIISLITQTEEKDVQLWNNTESLRSEYYTDYNEFLNVFIQQEVKIQGIMEALILESENSIKQSI